MKSEKLPAMMFYPGDWKKDVGVQSLEIVVRYFWFELLMLMHDSEERGVLLLNGKPMPIEKIARCVQLDEQTASKFLDELKQSGVCSVRDDGAIYSRRMVKDEDIRQKRIKAGAMGGKAILVKQKRSKGASKSEANCKQNPEDENESEDVIDHDHTHYQQTNNYQGTGGSPEGGVLQKKAAAAKIEGKMGACSDSQSPKNPASCPKVSEISEDLARGVGQGKISPYKRNEENRTSPESSKRDIVLDDYMQRAQKHLTREDAEGVARDSRFVTAGRLPMIKYPLIWISITELAQVLQTFESQMPKKFWPIAFQKVEARLKTQEINGQQSRRVSPFNWLVGWALTETLEQAVKNQKLELFGGKNEQFTGH